MARKDAILKMREILVVRRDALRKALAGDLSLLKELREQTAGDVIDFALDSAQHEINSQLAEVESRELASIENALERMRTGHFGVCEHCQVKIPMARLMRCRMPPCASSASAMPSAKVSPQAWRPIGDGWSTAAAMSR